MYFDCFGCVLMVGCVQYNFLIDGYLFFDYFDIYYIHVVDILAGYSCGSGWVGGCGGCLIS